MQSFLIALLECSVSMSVIILIFMAITPLLSRRYAAKWLYYAWLVIVIGLIVPFRFHFDNTLLPLNFPHAPVYIQPRNLLNDNTIDYNHIQTDMQVSTLSKGENGFDYRKTGTVGQGLADITWYQGAVFIWIMGTIIFAIHHIIRHLRFLKMVKRWGEPVFHPQILDIMQNLQTKLKISQQAK